MVDVTPGYDGSIDGSRFLLVVGLLDLGRDAAAGGNLVPVGAPISGRRGSRTRLPEFVSTRVRRLVG